MNTSSTTVCQSIVYDGETLFYQGFAQTICIMVGISQ